MDGRRLLRDLGGIARFPSLRCLGLDPEDAGRLDVVSGVVREAGYYVDVERGEERLLQVGDAVPDGIWVARRDLAELTSGSAEDVELAGGHGFGEGWGAQGVQIGEGDGEDGDREQVRRETDLPGVTGDPTRNPAGERGLAPEVPDPRLAEAGYDQLPVRRSVDDGDDAGATG